MSRRPPAFRAVTVPLSPAFVAIATPSGESWALTASCASGRAGRDSEAIGDGAGATVGFILAPDFEDGGWHGHQLAPMTRGNADRSPPASGSVRRRAPWSSRAILAALPVAS